MLTLILIYSLLSLSNSFISKIFLKITKNNNSNSNNNKLHN